MLTPDEIKFLKDCSDTEKMQSIIEKCNIIPAIMVTISDGCFRYATANMKMELVIEDKDTIEHGGSLEYPCTIENSIEGFNAAHLKAQRDVVLEHAYRNREDEIKEIRIFIYDTDDKFPVNLMIDSEVVATFKTFDEASDFLVKYNNERLK